MAKKAESKKAGSKKEASTKKPASIAGEKKSPDQLPQSGFVKNHELYWRTQIDSDLIIEAIQMYYGSFGDVRTTFPEDREECLTVHLFKNKQAKLPVIEVSQESWADEIVAPDLAHFWGVGKIVEISDETQFYGIHEFLYERESEVLKFDQTTAKQCFFHLAQVNSELWGKGRPNWCKYSQFSFLIYRLLQLGETMVLQEYIKRTELDEKSRGLNEQLSLAMVHIYMVGAGAGNYFAEDRFRGYTQERFDNMFQEHGLEELQFTDLQRIAALEAMIAQGGGNEFVEAALSALRKRK